MVKAFDCQVGWTALSIAAQFLHWIFRRCRQQFGSNGTKRQWNDRQEYLKLHLENDLSRNSIGSDPDFLSTIPNL